MLLGSPSSPSTPVNMQMVEMSRIGRVPPEAIEARKRQQASQPTQNPQQFTELAKWKAVEIFKVGCWSVISQSSHLVCLVQITVNYLQVIAIAISVNVSWTDTLISVFETAGD